MNTNRRRQAKRTRAHQPANSGLPSAPNELLWTLLGLLLTIAATFVEAFVAIPSWPWHDFRIPPVYSLGITCQIGAVLLVGSLGGKNAAVLSQIAYVVLGLIWLPVFGQGGGWSYWQQGSFGYILGFIPGAWLCGWLALRNRAKLETLAFSSLCGLGMIHLCGLLYLGSLAYWQGSVAMESDPWDFFQAAAHQYSVAPLPGQLTIVCCVAVLAYFLRKLLFY